MKRERAIRPSSKRPDDEVRYSAGYMLCYTIVFGMV